MLAISGWYLADDFISPCTDKNMTETFVNQFQGILTFIHFQICEEPLWILTDFGMDYHIFKSLLNYINKYNKTKQAAYSNFLTTAYINNMMHSEIPFFM